MNENGEIISQNLKDAAKAEIEEEFRANAYIKKDETFQINSVPFHTKKTGKRAN